VWLGLFVGSAVVTIVVDHTTTVRISVLAAFAATAAASLAYPVGRLVLRRVRRRRIGDVVRPEVTASVPVVPVVAPAAVGPVAVRPPVALPAEPRGLTPVGRRVLTILGVGALAAVWRMVGPDPGWAVELLLLATCVVIGTGPGRVRRWLRLR
jgi:hypothetical protein